MFILTLNCRRFSVQYQLFDWAQKKVLARGAVERVMVGDSFITHKVPGRSVHHFEQECPDHRAAVELILTTLSDGKVGVIDTSGQVTAIGHRVAHGGEKFTSSMLIDDEVLAAINEMVQLAPLHNTPNMAGILAAMEILPDIPHVAIFDTAFHQTMPPAAYIYPLPYEWYEKYGVRRYGFHGQSHLYASKRAADLLGKPAEQCSLITVHTGNGVSLCAIKNGISIDTSMGLTPLEGAMMGTRCGDIDPGIPPFMMRETDMSPHELDMVLNQKSGVIGITGRHTSRRTVLEEARVGDPRCKTALELESYRLKKYIGSYCAVTGPLDAIVFAYGEGWADWPVRGMALQGMEHFGIRLDAERDRLALAGGGEMLISSDDSPVKLFVVPTDEELVFVEDVAAILAGESSDPARFDYSFARSAGE
ncbi:acetate kinase [Geotalea uraniireducens]|uniref:Acetate kinase n=1 Tax=Geotalea uraniireducens (strain Rf4) TaxID=351605 RepID=A5GCU0_GEOUR|nr:acetate kinase [Geotalea uraniireducens]ABQ24610.1 acetate kinase [Geotalea uraniireducens Rf4]